MGNEELKLEHKWAWTVLCEDMTKRYPQLPVVAGSSFEDISSRIEVLEQTYPQIPLRHLAVFAAQCVWEEKLADPELLADRELTGLGLMFQISEDEDENETGI